MAGTLKDVLSAATAGDNLAGLIPRLHAVINAMNSDQNIHPLMKNDVVIILRCVVALTESICDDAYPVDSVTDNVAALMSTASNILAHVTHNRPAFYGYGLEHLKTKNLLAGVFRTRGDAERELNNLKALGTLDAIRIVPIRVSSQVVNRPTLIQYSQEAIAPPKLENSLENQILQIRRTAEKLNARIEPKLPTESPSNVEFTTPDGKPIERTAAELFADIGKQPPEPIPFDLEADYTITSSYDAAGNRIKD